MQLSWIKCEGDTWCKFLTVNLDHPHFHGLEGVYIIWHGGQHSATVYVGQGEVAARLKDHRNDKDILRYSPQGLFVTWTRVDRTSRDGVERYLANRLAPKVGTHHPQAAPITVNLPW